MGRVNNPCLAWELSIKQYGDVFAVEHIHFLEGDWFIGVK